MLKLYFLNTVARLKSGIVRAMWFLIKYYWHSAVPVRQLVRGVDISQMSHANAFDVRKSPRAEDTSKIQHYTINVADFIFPC